MKMKTKGEVAQFQELKFRITTLEKEFNIQGSIVKKFVPQQSLADRHQHFDR